MAPADWTARLIWIPNAVRHNPPESPNVVKSWRVHLEEMPECPLKTEALRALAANCEDFGEGFLKAFREACPVHMNKPTDNQDQDQDQEQESSRATVPQSLPGSLPYLGFTQKP